MSDGVAVVGMACRYPGARSPGELWENVLAGRREFRRIPPSRRPPAGYGYGDPDDPDGTYLRHGAFLADYDFDRVAFRVAGDAYRSADLVHWLALDVAARALESAGFPSGEGLPRPRTGVLVGNSLTGEQSRANMLRLHWPYVAAVTEEVLAEEGVAEGRLEELLDRLEARFKDPFPEMNEVSLAGALSNTIAGRVCNHFDLGGGGYTVDGACASSLLSVARACSALRAGELDVAVAGGVDVSLDPLELVGFARVGALARDEMRVFDARPQGFWPGEGAGMVVLMREADARDSGRPVHAVIRGWGISSDGSGGLTRPERRGQLRALRRAYRGAGYSVDAVGYFEGHGTGTPVGDETELETLTAALHHAGAGRPAALGSIKANIGHTKAAAGVAGLIKAALAVREGVLPPTTGTRTPHPVLRCSPRLLRVLRRGEPWRTDDGRGPRRAAVNSFGFGGINVHLTLEGGSEATGGSDRDRGEAATARVRVPAPQEHELFAFGAATAGELEDRLGAVAERAPGLAWSELGDLSARLREGLPRPSEAPWRAAVVARRPGGLADGVRSLRGALDRGEDPGRVAEMEVGGGARAFLGVGEGEPRVGFLFPGQGGEVPRDPGALGVRFDVVRRAFRRGAGDRPDDGGREGPPATRMVQPAVVAASVAGLELLERLGLEARIAVGHSLGELTALHWGGALDREQTLRLARLRGRLMEERAAPGAMAALSAGPGSVRALLEALEGGDGARAPGLRVAALNAPDRTVVSGPTPDVDALLVRARSEGVPGTRLPVDRAFHTPAFREAARAFREAVRGEGAAPLERTVASTTTGGILEGAVDVADLLGLEMISPVRFTEAVGAASARGVDLWIEVGAGRSASTLVERGRAGAGGAEGAPDGPPPALPLAVGGPSLEPALVALAAAHAAGVALALEPLFRDRLHRPFDLDHRPRFVSNPCAVASPRPRHATAPLRERPPEGVEPGTVSPGGDASPSAEAPDAGPGPSMDGDMPPAVDGDVDVAGLVRRLLAERTELPPARIQEEDHLLADLHLNSIAVAGVVGKAARLIGLDASRDPTALADATVGRVIGALEEEVAGGTAPARAPARGDGAGTEAGAPDGAREGRRGDDAPPSGVAAWVRPFRLEWTPAPPPPVGREEGRRGWRVLGPTGGSPLASRLRKLLPHRAPGGGVAVCLDDALDAGGVARLVEACRALLPEAEGSGEDAPARRLLLVHRGSAGEAFARSLRLEAPDVPVRCVELPAGPTSEEAADRAAEEAVGAAGFRAVRYDGEGRRWEARLRPLSPAGAREGAPAPGPDDVFVASGGGKGITAECALALGRETGARLALLGRSHPADDPALARSLARFGEAGVSFEYLRCDVTDREAVEAAVARVRRRLGEPTGLLHGAGRNVPRGIADLDPSAVLETVAPKVEGLRSLVSALDPDRLRTVVAFGSVLARTGMRGNADYALANEWLRRVVERFGAAHPECRCLVLEWSVWSGVGMGERLGRIEALARQGVEAIPPDEGVRRFLELLSRPDAPTSVVVSGRFGTLPTLAPATEELPLLRYLERPRVHCPGVELVADAELSVPGDPYLADHALDGEPLFPAVMALEAMAQAAVALVGPGRRDDGEAEPDRPAGFAFRDVELRRPITVPADGARSLRVAALVEEPGVVRVALRSDETDFSVDHVRGLCRVREGRSRGAEPRDSPAPGSDTVPGTSLSLDPQRELYGRLLFQDGRFRRLGRYRRLDARAYEADLEGDGPGRWFGPYQPRELVLGDPGVRDAALHGIQACIPHRVVLPVAVEEIVVPGPGAEGPRAARARERPGGGKPEGRAFTYDLEIGGPGSSRGERWRGVRLRAVGGRPDAPASWPPALLGPYLERVAAEHLEGAAPRVVVGEGSDSRATLIRLLGRPVTLERGGDGRPLVDGDERVSASHCAGLTLVVADVSGTGPDAPGCDVEAVAGRTPAEWRDVLGDRRAGLGRSVADAVGEAPDAAATRIWTVVEAVKKATGAAPASPTLERAPGDGWAVFRAEGLRVATCRLRVRGVEPELVFALAAGGSRRPEARSGGRTPVREEAE